MKRNMFRNRTMVILLLLVTYSLTFFIASLHYHKYDFIQQCACESEKSSASNHFLFLDNNSYECIILLHLANIHKAIISTSYNQTKDFITPYFIQIPFAKKHIISGYSSSNNLRAPPKLS